MIKPDDPRKLAEALLKRSTCSVRVAAVIADKNGIFSWGWNNVGQGYGQHAEAHAITRANKKRLYGATIYVASERNRSGRTIISKPCFSCGLSIDTWYMKVVWRNKDGNWINE